MGHLAFFVYNELQDYPSFCLLLPGVFRIFGNIGHQFHEVLYSTGEGWKHEIRLMFHFSSVLVEHLSTGTLIL